MIHYQFTQRDFETWLKDFGQFLNTEVNKNCLSLPKEDGEGFLYAGNLKAGMSFLYVNALFHQDILFERVDSEDAGLVLYFNEVHISNFYKVASGDQEIFARSKEHNMVLLNSTQFPLSMHLTKDSHLRLIGIKFSEKLVRKFIKSNNLAYIKSFTRNNLNNATDEYLTPEVQRLLQEVYHADVHKSLGRFVLLNRILLLVEKFLHLFFTRELPPDKQYHPSQEELESLEKVEAFLTDVPDDFPSIEKLARMAMMSSTKLKIRFKEVYGMKLYEYYNNNRLAKAKQWIESGTASVQDAAYRIGFTSSSNFSKAFKKEFGVLPSKLKAWQPI
jgi:AraC-like DNA-binding protein